MSAELADATGVARVFVTRSAVHEGIARVPAGTICAVMAPAGYGKSVLAPLIASLGRDDVRLIEVEARFFGGNVGVAGLMVGEDLQRVLSSEPAGHRYLLPDVCLSGGRFLDGLTPEDLPRPVDIIPTDGVALRRALGLAMTEIARND